MTPALLLAELHRHGATVEAHDGRLRIIAPDGALDPGLIVAVQAQKPALLALLAAAPEAQADADRSPATPAAPSAVDVADVAEHYEERAAVREFLGGLARPHAERLAALETVRALLPDGWQAESWAHELRRRAGIIDDPAVAERFRAAADRIMEAVAQGA